VFCVRICRESDGAEVVRSKVVFVAL